MYVRRVKRKCGVRGCKHTDSYAISLTSEVGNTVIACKECLLKAFKAIESGQIGANAPKKKTSVPPLFFNAGAVSPAEDIHEEESFTTDNSALLQQQEAPAEDIHEEEFYVCPHCGQVCKSELGLQKHIAAKHKDEA